MLNLLVRLMRPWLFLPLVLLLIAAQDTPPVAITSPRAGDILFGQVTIAGTTDIPDFLDAQLDFAYASDITPASGLPKTWFPLQIMPQPAQDSALFTWDTLSITDGDYILRLRVNLTDGAFQEVIVPIRIQNDTPISTPTPIPTATPEEVISVQIPTPFLLAASPTPTEVPRPTPTPLSMNPVSLSQNEILLSLGRGALVILGLFIFSGILIRIRRS